HQGQAGVAKSQVVVGAVATPTQDVVAQTNARLASVAATINSVTPTVDKEATVQAWLAAPVSTDTPWPTATPVPTEEVPAFKASSEKAPKCSLFIGYVGPKKKECADYFATATAVATDD